VIIKIREIKLFDETKVSHTKKGKALSWAWWCRAVIPDTQEADRKDGGSMPARAKSYGDPISTNMPDEVACAFHPSYVRHR
jgi:hypothetical protein